MIVFWVVVLAVAGLLTGSRAAYAADWGLSAIGGNFLFLPIALVLVFLFLRFRGALSLGGLKATLERGLRYLVGIPLAWVVLAGLHRLTGYPPASMLTPLWIVLVLLIVGGVAGSLIPAPVRRFWASLFGIRMDDTHGTARFEVARNATRHLAPAAPADGFVLGSLRDARGADRRFRQDGHVLTCAPTGAGKGIGAVIPNLLAYPGSAFVLDFKGENYAVTARTRRDSGQAVLLVDPFNITGAATHRLNWLDTLDPDDPDVVSRAAGLADMLVVAEGADSDSHWNDTARELLRGLLVYVAGLPPDRRSRGRRTICPKLHAKLQRVTKARFADG